MRTLVQDEIIWQQTKKYGITVSDNELAQDIQSYPYFLNENGQFDSRNYYQFLSNLRMSPKDFEYCLLSTEFIYYIFSVILVLL